MGRRCIEAAAKPAPFGRSSCLAMSGSDVRLLVLPPAEAQHRHNPRIIRLSAKFDPQHGARLLRFQIA